MPHQGLLCTKHLIIIIASSASCVHLCLKRETASRLLGGSYLLGRPAPAGPHLRWPRNRQGWQRHGPFACLPSEEERGPSVGGTAAATASKLRHLYQQRRLRQEPACPPRPRRADSGVKWVFRRLRQSPVLGTQLGHAGAATGSPALGAGRLLAHICVPEHSWGLGSHSVSVIVMGARVAC